MRADVRPVSSRELDVYCRERAAAKAGHFRRPVTRPVTGPWKRKVKPRMTMDSDYRPDWHPDEKVLRAGIAFLDALCTHERDTGIASSLIFRDEHGHVLRAHDGKPGLPTGTTDFRALSRYTGREQMTKEEILHSGFEAIALAIEEGPLTWLPGFLIRAAEAGARRGVFLPGGAAELAAKAEERAHRPRA